MKKFIMDLVDDDISDEPNYKPNLVAIHYTYKLFSKSLDIVADILRVQPYLAKELNSEIEANVSSLFVFDFQNASTFHIF